MNKIAPKNHNNPPSPIDEALAPYGDFISEAEAWLDGSPVETEAQMKSVDDLTKAIKAAKKAVTDAEESEAKPIYDQWKSKKAEFAPTLTDLDRIVKGLLGIVGAFKTKLAAEKEAARKKAEAEAWEATRKAQEAMRTANVSNIDAQREADDLAAQAKEAQRMASAAKNDTVKGMRTVTRTVILDPVGLARWLWANDRAAQEEFQADRARKLAVNIPGVAEQVTSKEPF